MWSDPFQVDVLLSLSTKGNSVFFSKHLTSVALNFGGSGGGKGKWGRVKILTGCNSYFSNVALFFLNCLAVTRSTKLNHEKILMGMN